MIKNAEKLLVHVAALITIIAAAFYLARLVHENSFVREAVSGYGYLGIFAVSFMSGFNLLVPVPAVAFLPLFLEAGQNFWITIFIIVVGVTVADFLAYLIGKLSRHIVMHATEKKILWEMKHLRSHWKWAPLAILFLFVAVVPFPNEVLLIPLGFLGYQFRYLLPIVFVGNLTFNLLYATGAIGLFRALL